MSVSRLQVSYNSPGIDKELDKKILNFFHSLSFVCIGRQFMSMIWRRELDFEIHGEIEEEANENKKDKEVKLKA